MNLHPPRGARGVRGGGARDGGVLRSVRADSGACLAAALALLTVRAP